MPKYSNKRLDFLLYLCYNAQHEQNEKRNTMALLIMILVWLAYICFFAIGMAVIMGANIWAGFFTLATFGCIRALWALKECRN